MILDGKRTVDPRDNLDKAHRRELVDFARANNLEVSEDMPADDVEGRIGSGLRSLLRSKGLTRITVPHRSIDNRIGDKTFPIRSKPAAPPQATSDEWAEFQQFKAWKAVQKPPAAVPDPAKPVAEMSITELRQVCKAKGVKLERRDTMDIMREKLGQIQ